MQDDFETWALTKELSLERHPEKERWGYDYYDIETQLFWECWQAASGLLVNNSVAK